MVEGTFCEAGNWSDYRSRNDLAGQDACIEPCHPTICLARCDAKSARSDGTLRCTTTNCERGWLLAYLEDALFHGLRKGCVRTYKWARRFRSARPAGMAMANS